MAKQTTWFRLDPAQLLIEVMECTPKEWYKRTLAIAKALIKEERGTDDFADRLMDDAEDYIEQRRSAGRASGIARSTRAKAGRKTEPETPNETRTDGERNANETRTDGENRSNGVQDSVRPTRVRPTVPTVPTEPTVPTDRQYKPTVPTVPTETERVAATTKGAAAERGASVGPSGHSPQGDHRPSDFGRIVADSLASVEGANDAARRKPKPPAFDWAAYGADPYAYLASVPNPQLPDFAAWFCHEPDNAEARKRYGAFCKAKGWLRFRGLLEGFIGECKSGEDPDNRGAALTKRVMEAWR